MSNSLRKRVILIGGGGHARVVIDALRTNPADFELLGFLDPDPCLETVQRFGVAHLGDEREYTPMAGLELFGLLGLGDTRVSPKRRDIVGRLAIIAQWATVIHARACVSSTATVGAGAVVMAGATIQTGSTIGRHCIVNTNASIDHEVVIGDFALVSPAVVIGGGVRVGSGAFIGLGACIRDHVTIGANATVAMGAVVVRDVEPNAMVRGIPAK